MRIVCSTEAAKDAATAVNDLLSEYKTQDVLLLLSGGSALALLDLLDTTTLSKHVTISVMDERYTFDPEVSNFSQLVATSFWQRASKQHVQAIDPRPVKDENCVQAAKRFDVALKHWHVTHREGVVIGLGGIGPDGHTAGILPHPDKPGLFADLFLQDDTCVVGYHVDERVSTYTSRITTTLTYFKRHIDHLVLYAVGAKKREALQALDQEVGTLHETPARIMRELPDVTIYTDQTR